MMTAHRFAPFVTLVSVVLVSTFRHGEAIICYQCNSEYDPRCGDPFDPYSLGTVNCSFQPRLEHLSHLESTICRKISQKVYGKDRVVRGCGYITDTKDNGDCLLRSGTHDVRAHYCACTGDLCNSAEKRRSSSLLNLATIATIVLAIPSLLLSNPYSLPVLTSSTLSVANLKELTRSSFLGSTSIDEARKWTDGISSIDGDYCLPSL